MSPYASSVTDPYLANRGRGAGVTPRAPGQGSQYPASFGKERPYYLDPREMKMIEERIVRVGTKMVNGELPYSVTPFDQGALGLTDEELMAAGYFQQMNGTWIAGTQDEGIGGYGGGGYGYGGGGGGYSYPRSSSIGSSNARFSPWGLTMWRIT